MSKSNGDAAAAESTAGVVHDNRRFAERAFYCIANGAGNCANGAGNWLLTREKQSIHLCRRDKTKNSAAAQRIVRSICPKSMPWNSPGMPESGRMKKTKNRRTARDRIWNRKV